MQDDWIVGLTKGDLYALNQIISHLEDEIGEPETSANLPLAECLRNLRECRKEFGYFLGIE